MLKYFVECHVKGGGVVTIPCKNKADYTKKTGYLELMFPNLDWKERREHRSNT